MIKKRWIEKTIATTLCIALLGTTLNSYHHIEAKEVENGQVELAKQDFTKNTMLNDPFADEAVAFAATYIKDINSIKALWEFNNSVSAEVFIRIDNSDKFELFSTTQEKYIDIPVNKFNNYCDIRIVISTDSKF